MINLNEYRANIYTHSGMRPCPGYAEDGVLQELFSIIGTSKNPFCVEFGELRVLGTTTRSFRIRYLADALYFASSLDAKSRVLNILDIVKVSFKMSNLRYFKYLFWLPKKREITPNNVLKSLRECRHREVDLMVIDIDSYDFQVAEAVLENSIFPKVLVVEYNPNFPSRENLYVKYEEIPKNSTNMKIYGASYQAWIELLTGHNYRLVHISGFCNLIFVRNISETEFVMPDIDFEITDTEIKVREFAEKFCLPGFLPSWCSSPKLTESELDLLRS